ncbi:type II toxin-antitoxin system PrlF family antitoxin [Marinomonas profundi]|uniref:type II toxin-antitoxin system PrlF family antitoxin n=1 Tax=Marinomonas profundi TaxID=2726122 RepID=UPI001B3ACCFA|nr:type II toxin-antitoxin system PrlF family antitoxin [Marinomonas profundi]UDV03417.1 type II toxin-antitoxin system PrlF family antitoxin [Marinomonas profundi]
MKKYDPVMNKFLSFLANGMPQHPENLQQLTVSMRNTVQSLIVDVEIDLDAPLSDEDE